MGFKTEPTWREHCEALGHRVAQLERLIEERGARSAADTWHSTEMALLGSMMIDSDTVGGVLEIIGPGNCELFRDSAHQILFNTIMDLYGANRPIDLLAMKKILDRRGVLEEIGGVVYLVRVAESVPDAANAVHYAKIVRNRCQGLKRGA